MGKLDDALNRLLVAGSVELLVGATRSCPVVRASEKEMFNVFALAARG